MDSNPLTWTGRALRRAGTELLRVVSPEGIWIDVGAHRGETTLHHALRNPNLKIFAFEPNLRRRDAGGRIHGHCANH